MVQQNTNLLTHVVVVVYYEVMGDRFRMRSLSKGGVAFTVNHASRLLVPVFMCNVVSFLKSIYYVWIKNKREREKATYSRSTS